ncbi:aminoacylase-1-like [Lutzomyia longipalpis]|uniref:N-acyl-aliphatic-L-amino acid amidohydrolase n=1 Tax=Lutzomyia longipalpis TaxID=7200 RepID=A0A1B0CBE6_LUTLO|nr:aminoacylase-1-like [Lutzomyia longipalpis]
MTDKWENDKEIQIFREYLRIPSVHPKPNYEPCVEFLRRQATSLAMDFKVYYPVNDKNPIVVLSLTGKDPSLPAIMLNSHMDVVPVFPEKWSHPPFSAHLDSDGKIFARGSQDMKCVGMQFLGAIRALKKDGVEFKRTIHATFVPDEEVGGKLGMAKFVHTDDFKALNVGFSLDEGIASPTDTFPVFYAERAIWHVYFHCSGTPGHGSLLHKNTAGEKVRYLIDKLMDLRKYEVKRLENNPELLIGDVTTVNLTKISGGVQSNVVPPLLTIGFDIRLAVDVDHTEFLQQLQKWCDEAGGGIEIEFEQKEPPVPKTTLDESNIYWVAFKSAIDEMKLNIRTQVFPGGTDSRYVREIGIPAVGFSPMNNTPVLLHDHDEYLEADVYLRGIDIFKRIISKVVNC